MVRANSFLKRTVKSTPSSQFVQTYARVGGFLYLVIIVAAIFAEVFVRSKLTAPGDASATVAISAVNFLDHFDVLMWLQASSSAVGIAILLPPLLAEVSLALWMMFKGVDLQKWRSREDRQVLEPSQ